MVRGIWRACLAAMALSCRWKQVADDLPADTHPNVATMLGFVTTTRPGSLVDFEFGLDLLLEGLERRLEMSVDGPGSP